MGCGPNDTDIHRALQQSHEYGLISHLIQSHKLDLKVRSSQKSSVLLS